MAEELLRLNFDKAFDPGPDFPHPMLLSRTMAMLDVEIDRSRSREFARPAWLLPVVAAILALAVVASLVIGSNAFHRPPSVPVYPRSSPVTRSISPQMTTATTGWSSASNPLERTTDGGAHWSTVNVPTGLTRPSVGGGGNFSEAEFFLGANQAWIARGAWSVPPRFEVLRTTDGGLSWQSSGAQNFDRVPAGSSGSGIFLGLWFLDSARGWLLVQLSADSNLDVLYTTTDGGLHWTAVSTNTWSVPGAPGYSLTGCAWTVPVFASASTGFMGYVPALCPAAAASYPSLLATNDGGTSWHFEPLPLTPTAGCQPGHSSCPVPRPSFVDELHGFLDAPLEGGFLATSDGGQSWIARPTPPGVSGWLNPSDGWSWSQPKAANPTPGSSPVPANLYFTHDGGQSWRQVQSDLTGLISQLYFVDQSTGFAVVYATGGSQLAKTTDGGAHWTLVGPFG